MHILIFFCILWNVCLLWQWQYRGKSRHYVRMHGLLPAIGSLECSQCLHMHDVWLLFDLFLCWVFIAQNVSQLCVLSCACTAVMSAYLSICLSFCTENCFIVEYFTCSVTFAFDTFTLLVAIVVTFFGHVMAPYKLSYYYYSLLRYHEDHLDSKSLTAAVFL